MDADEGPDLPGEHGDGAEGPQAAEQGGDDEALGRKVVNPHLDSGQVDFDGGQVDLDRADV